MARNTPLIVMRKLMPSSRKNTSGSAIVATLSVIALLTVLIVAFLQSVRIQVSQSAAGTYSETSHLSAESGIDSACALLLIATWNRPAYLTGLPSHWESPGQSLDESNQVTPPLLIGATNLTNTTQLLPLFSFDLSRVKDFPNLKRGTVEKLFDELFSTNPSHTIDLNSPALLGTGSNCPRLVAPQGSYPALWQSIRDEAGNVVGRYAYVMTDESARLNPALHVGNKRTDPMAWDHGPGDLPLANGSDLLPDLEEADHLHLIAASLPTAGSFEIAFHDPADYEQKKFLLTKDPCLTPDLIPASMPEGGLPKYNLNDLATNPLWGKTPYDRATNIARIIDKNLPKFKQRDLSLPTKQGILYPQRLACSIVDYISPTLNATGPSPDQPLGRDLNPYVTKIAERCTLKEISSNSATIESRFFAEVWNPTTSSIPAGGVAKIIIGNRSRVKFGNALEEPFRDYCAESGILPAMRPNEFLVISFPPMEQTWLSPTPTKESPNWDTGPTANRDNGYQNFEFSWNGVICDRTRPKGISPKDQSGGLEHVAGNLSVTNRLFTQVVTVPTQSGNSQGDQESETDSAINPGKYRVVGDPRQTILTSYLWRSVKDYTAKTRWNGINPAGLKNEGYLLDPKVAWTSRDLVPVDPVEGVHPSDTNQLPGLVASLYNPQAESANAPSVIRKGPMVSLAELGNVYDPVQADDQGDAPNTGQSNRLNHFGCGGGRTLRVGQPEFQFLGGTNWNVPGKRAIDLLDLFTVADAGRCPDPEGTNGFGTNAGIAGRINVNTASHPVLLSLFAGIAVNSDARYSNRVIGTKAAENLASILEANRPFSKLSDLCVLTTNLVNANTYTPTLSTNVPRNTPPAAAVFDRAREEAFGKIIGHCILQSRVFHLYVIGEALDKKGRSTARSLVEELLRLEPDAKGHLIPTPHDILWH